MAKTNGSLFSLNAHGSLAKTLTFSKRKSGQQCRSYNKPLKSPSPKQRGQRRLTEFLVAQWQNMSDVDKATWATNARASGVNLPGYHYFLREAQRDLYTHHGLLVYWHLNEYVNGLVKDLSGAGLDGTPYPSYPSNVPTLVKSYIPKLGKAADFDGVDEYIKVAHTAIFNLGLGNFTVEFLLWLDEDQADVFPFSKTDFTTGWKGIHLRVSSGPQIRPLVGDGTTTAEPESFSIPFNAWVLITVRRTASTLDLLVNSVIERTIGGANLNIDNSDPLVIGADAWETRVCKCRIDELCYYNRALSDAEIATRYKFMRRGTS